jgi:hypothetical protein
LRLALALPAKQNTAIGKGMVLDPFDAPAACEKFLNGFLSRICISLGRHGSLQLMLRVYGPLSPPVARTHICFILALNIGCILQ